MRTTKQLRGFYAGKFSACNSLSPLLKEQETVSLPCGTSAFARRDFKRRVNRMRIDVPSPSIRLRYRFPLHPSLSPMDGVSIEVEDEARDNRRAERYNCLDN